MGMAAIGSNLTNWATKIGDTVNTVLDTAQPFIDLYNKGNQIAEQLKNKGKPPRSNGDAAVAPGQIPTDAQLSSPLPKSVSQTNGQMPLIVGAVAIAAILLLKK
jgi:hypothetical protein